MDYFSKNIYKCCNPIGKHSAIIRKNLHVIDSEDHEAMKSINITLVPGDKVCFNCLKFMKAKVDAIPSTSDIEGNTDALDDTHNLIMEHDVNQMNELLTSVGTSPITYGKLSQSQLKHKIQKKSKNIPRKFLKFCSPVDAETDLVDIDLAKENNLNSKSLNKFVELLKTKMLLAESTEEKIKLMTLVPDHWTKQ